MPPDDSLDAAVARLRAACDADDLDRWRRGLNLLADHAGAVEVTGEALQHVAATRGAAWADAWVETFGPRALDTAAHLLLGRDSSLSPATAGVLLGLVVDRGDPELARRCALAWLGQPDDHTLAAQVRATLRVTATADDLVATLSAPDADVRRGAAMLAERRLTGVEPAAQTAVLDTALTAETEAGVARLLRRARVTASLRAAIDAGRRDGDTLNTCLAHGADLGALPPPGRVSATVLRWRDGVGLDATAGRVLLDAIGDEDARREVPLVALVRRQLDDASCEAFAEQLRAVWRGSSLLPWVQWAEARFGSGSRLVRLASERRRHGERDVAIALLERSGSPDARALLERWRGDAWGWLADGEPGVGLASLLDRGVSSCGLDSQRRRGVRVGHHKLAVELTGDGRTRLVEPRTGVVLPRLPARGPGDHAQRQHVRELREEIERTWTLARRRLTEPDRRWSVATFRHDVLHHPVLRAAATTLRWQLVAADGTVRALRVRLDGHCVGEADGEVVELDEGVEVVCPGPIGASQHGQATTGVVGRK